MRCGKHQPRGRTENAVQHPSATDWNERRTGDYSFPGSAWERIGVEAPASRVHKLRLHFGEAEPRLHRVTKQNRRAWKLDRTVQQNLQSVSLWLVALMVTRSVSEELFVPHLRFGL